MGQAEIVQVMKPDKWFTVDDILDGLKDKVNRGCITRALRKMFQYGELRRKELPHPERKNLIVCTYMLV